MKERIWWFLVGILLTRMCYVEASATQITHLRLIWPTGFSVIYIYIYIYLLPWNYISDQMPSWKIEVCRQWLLSVLCSDTIVCSWLLTANLCNKISSTCTIVLALSSINKWKLILVIDSAFITSLYNTILPLCWHASVHSFRGRARRGSACNSINHSETVKDDDENKE